MRARSVLLALAAPAIALAAVAAPAHASAAPAHAAATPVIYKNASWGDATRRPSMFSLGNGNAPAVRHLSWSSWGQASARSSGSTFGGLGTHSVKVHLYRVRTHSSQRFFTRMSWYFSGHTSVMRYYADVSGRPYWHGGPRLPGAAPAAETGAIVIREIFYNSPGLDNGSNASLNGEWVKIYNRSSSSVHLTGWTLRDKQHHVYTFGVFTLRSKQSVKVRTGSGHNTTTNLYQGRRAYIWNNTGDKATLRKTDGTFRDSCSYGNSGASSVNC